jgi:hypothetical protein
VYGEIAFLDDTAAPNALKEFVLRHGAVAPLHERYKNVKGSATDRNLVPVNKQGSPVRDQAVSPKQKLSHVHQSR